MVLHRRQHTGLAVDSDSLSVRVQVSTVYMSESGSDIKTQAEDDERSCLADKGIIMSSPPSVRVFSCSPLFRLTVHLRRLVACAQALTFMFAARAFVCTADDSASLISCWPRRRLPHPLAFIYVKLDSQSRVRVGHQDHQG